MSTNQLDQHLSDLAEKRKAEADRDHDHFVQICEAMRDAHAVLDSSADAERSGFQFDLTKQGDGIDVIYRNDIIGTWSYLKQIRRYRLAGSGDYGRINVECYTPADIVERTAIFMDKVLNRV